MLCMGLASTNTFAQDDATVHQVDATQPTGTLLDVIPETIDRLPTVLPEQSDQRIVPQTQQTKDNSWVDQKQYKFTNKLQQYAHKIDNWFGETDPNDPASANLRIMMDTRWNRYDDFSVKPRIRGRIKLPTLENRFSVVFGDDSLDNEIRGNVGIDNENPQGNPDKTLDRRQTRDDNASIALRWSRLSKSLGIDTDADLGVRSGDDVYLRLKAQKDWELNNHFSTHAEQIYRYGLDSKHYLRTNLELRHARPNEAFLSDQLSFTYTDDSDESNFIWENRIFRQHQFFHNNWFNYGIYTTGNLDDGGSKFNSYGPFVSWRQPVWREWFFVQSELNYYNNKDLDRSHYLSALLRLEAWF